MEQERSRHSANPDVLVALDAKANKPADDSSFALLRSNITEAIRILVLRRWAFFVPFCLVTCIAAIGSHWIHRTYESATVIERRDHAVLLNLRQTTATGDFASFFRPTLINDFKSLDAMTDVVADAGIVPNLERTPEGKLTEESARLCRAAALSVTADLAVQLQQTGEHFDQIRISYRGPSPAIPQRIVAAAKDVYVRRTRQRLVEMLDEARSYFDNVVDKRRNEISRLEEDLLAFQAEYIGVDPTDPGALKLKLTSLESEHDELHREIATLKREYEAREHLLNAYRARRDMIRGQANAQGRNMGSIELPSMAKSAEAQELEQEIRKLQDEIHELQLTRRMTDRHPDVVERRERIDRLRENLKKQYLADVETLPANRGAALDPEAADSAVEQSVGWDVELAGLQMGVQDRAGRLEMAESRLRVVDQDIAKHKSLEDNVFRYRREYKLKADLLAQAQIDLNNNAKRVMEISGVLSADESERGVSFSVLTQPTPCLHPVSPKGTTIMVFAVLAGLAGGALSVLFRELFDQSYHTTRHITRSLGLAMLESIDEIVTSADRVRRLRRRVLLTPAAVSILALCVGVACAAAYLSVEKPLAYENLIETPREWWARLHGGPAVAKASESLGQGEVIQQPVIAPAPVPMAQPKAEDAPK